jgi:acetyltransferase-like isoleucine patch superfamily enzyme
MSFISVGKDFYLSDLTVIKRPELIKIGNHVAIDQFVTITTQAEIGDYVHIAPNCSIIGGVNSKVIFEDHSGMAAGARVIAGGADFNSGFLTNPQVPSEFTCATNSVVKFEKFSILSTNSVVMSGVTLAEGCVIGANSVVLKDTEPWTIYVGSPAKPIKKREKGNIYEYYKKLKDNDVK